uniref:Uncharacterized protein n=1 Tax=Populus alba TaxID=43335 RepID=A0A4U5Q509_POPAL|nr:hypothetical protein D5086_0000139450 [Populus alba]
MNAGLNGAPIRVAIDFLTNRILSYLIYGPITKYFPSGTWIYYSRRGGQSHLGFRIYKEYYTYVGTKTISSDFLSIIIVLLIALLIFTLIFRAILFLFGLSCLVTYLIYTWRRRHLSMYDIIEEFLQNNNNLMPVRKKNLSQLVEDASQIYFPSWVYEQVCEGNDLEVLGDTTEQEKKITKKMIIVASWCIQLKPEDRPSMHEVVKMLEADVESLQMSPKHFLTTSQLMPKHDDVANQSDLSSYCINSSYQFGR